MILYHVYNTANNKTSTITVERDTSLYMTTDHMKHHIRQKIMYNTTQNNSFYIKLNKTIDHMQTHNTTTYHIQTLHMKTDEIQTLPRQHMAYKRYLIQQMTIQILHMTTDDIQTLHVTIYDIQTLLVTPYAYTHYM